MTGSVFPHDFDSDLRSPGLHIADLGRLQIVIDRDAILIRDGRVKGQLLGAVEYCLNLIPLQPITVKCHFPASNPDTGYDLVDIFPVFSLIFHYRGR